MLDVCGSGKQRNERITTVELEFSSNMGNAASLRREQQTEELRQGISDSHLQYFIQALSSSPGPTNISTAVAEIRVTKQQLLLLFGYQDNQIGTLNNSFRTALVDELFRSSSSILDDGTTKSTPFQLSFYQITSTIKALVTGGCNPLLRTMNTIFDQLSCSTLKDRVRLCHNLLYAPVVLNGSSLSPADNTNNLDPQLFQSLFSTTLRSFLALHCFQDSTARPPALPHNLNSKILSHDSTFLLSMVSNHRKMLLDDCASTWDKLYSDIDNGTNFNNMCDALIGYEGPTIVVVKDTNACTFGMLNREPWHYSDVFFGPPNGNGCCLFSLEPHFQLLLPHKRRGASTNYNWMNSKAHRKDLPCGLGMGGESDYFRFFISSTFKSNTSRPSGLTFDPGQIASKESFEIGTIEIWGCGGTGASDKRLEKKEEERIFQESRRKIDKKQLMDGFTAEFLLADTFKHRSEQNERVVSK